MSNSKHMWPMKTIILMNQLETSNGFFNLNYPFVRKDKTSVWAESKFGLHTNTRVYTPTPQFKHQHHSHTVSFCVYFAPLFAGIFSSMLVTPCMFTYKCITIFAPKFTTIMSWRSTISQKLLRLMKGLFCTKYEFLWW